MFKTDKVIITISASNYKYFHEKYNVNKKDKIEVFISELNKGSNTNITVICDECQEEHTLAYKKYIKYGYKNGNYLCRMCKLAKNNLKKYGVKSVLQLSDVKSKISKTIEEKYKVKHISQSEEIKKLKKKNSLEKTGYEHHMKNPKILEKQIQTNIKIHGVKNVSQLQSTKDKISEKWKNKSEEELLEIKQKRLNNKKTTDLEKKEKTEKTVNEKYGVRHISQLISVKNKKIEKSILNYGCKYVFQADEIKNKIKQTIFEIYGVDHISKNEDIKQLKNETFYNSFLLKKIEIYPNILNIDIDHREFEIYCECCKQNYKIDIKLFYNRNKNNITTCTNCSPVNGRFSGEEVNLLNFIKEHYTDEIVTNDRTILNGQELDIFLPKLNLAFEYNGLYWHSELFKNNKYHVNKTNECNSKNIKLIHIWEDDWLYKQDITKSIILNKLGKTQNKIFARKCVIREITDTKIIKKFLDDNHIQGYVKSKIKIGLYYNEKLVSLMTFKENDNNYELSRFCNIINTNIVGGSSKLFKYFLNNSAKKPIISFANVSNFTGDLYYKLKFKLDKIIKSDYSYILNGKRSHKFNFRKTKFNNPYNLTERELLFNMNIFRIYDCGKLKFIFKKL